MAKDNAKDNQIVKGADKPTPLFDTKGDNHGQQFGIRNGVKGDNNRVSNKITQNNTWNHNETNNIHQEMHDDHSTHLTHNETTSISNSYSSSTAYDSHDTYTSIKDSYNQTHNSYTSYADHSVTNNVQNISASFTDAKQVAVFGMFFSGAGEAFLMAATALAILGFVFFAYVILIAEALGVATAAFIALRAAKRYLDYRDDVKEYNALRAEQAVMLAAQREHELRLAELSRPVGDVHITINTNSPVGLPANPQDFARGLLAQQNVRVIDQQPASTPKQLTADYVEPIEMPVRRQKVMVRR